MPLTSNGILSGALDKDFMYVGGGDGKVKKVTLSNLKKKGIQTKKNLIN